MGRPAVRRRDVYEAIRDGSVWRPGRWGLTLGVAAPILLVAIGTIVNSRAGLINIGQEGQLVMGACFAAFVGVRVGGPGPLALLLLLLARASSAERSGRASPACCATGATCPRC